MPRSTASSSWCAADARQLSAASSIRYIGRGDFVLNVSVDVSSIALIKFCWSKGAMYLDTCIEPWPGGYTDATIPHARRTNYALREEALALRTRQCARAHRGAHARREPRPGVALRQAGAAEYRRRHRRRRRRAEVARGLGPARAQAGHQGDPHRRARHAALVEAERAQRIRQHLVGRRLRQRRPAAGRARLGHAREELSARRQALRLRQRRGYLPDAARRGHARAHLDAARPAISTAS